MPQGGRGGRAVNTEELGLWASCTAQRPIFLGLAEGPVTGTDPETDKEREGTKGNQSTVCYATMSALSTLVSLADQLRADPPERDEAREALAKCDELAAILRAAAAPPRDDAPPSAKLVPLPDKAPTLSTLAPELLARVVAAPPSVADVCRIDRVSRLFASVPPPRSVVEALRLRACAKAMRRRSGCVRQRRLRRRRS